MMGWGCYKHEWDAGSHDWEVYAERLCNDRLKSHSDWGRDGQVCPKCYEEELAEKDKKIAGLEAAQVARVHAAVMEHVDADCEAAEAIAAPVREANGILKAQLAALREALEPFAKAGSGIPDNWPGECVLTWEAGEKMDPKPTGQYYAFINFLTVQAQGGPRIEDYRKAEMALAADAGKAVTEDEIEEAAATEIKKQLAAGAGQGG